MIAIQTSTLVDASTDATGTAVFETPAGFHKNRIWCFPSANATVNLQGSPDGSNWVTFHTITNETEAATISDPFENMRITWTGNTGTLTVKLSQYYDNPREAI